MPTTRYAVECSCGYPSYFLIQPTYVKCAKCGKVIDVDKELSATLEAKKQALQEGSNG